MSLANKMCSLNFTYYKDYSFYQFHNLFLKTAVYFNIYSYNT